MKYNVKNAGKAVAFLTREQIDFIDKLSKDALFSTGRRLSRSAIIQAMVEAFRKLDFAGSGVKSAEELEKKMLDVAKESLSTISEELKKDSIKVR